MVQNIETEFTYAMTFIVVPLIRAGAVRLIGPLVQRLVGRNVLRLASWAIDSVEYDLLKECHIH